jgi:hypothetical protein
MDFHRPDPEPGSTPPGARVEDDFVRPLKPLRGMSHFRLPAALPFAIAGILVVSSVAFGASVFRSAITPTSSATPVVVGGDDPVDPTPTPTATPTPTPTPTPTEAPVTDPVPGELALTVSLEPGKAKLEWSAYTGADFAFYKIVRSTDAEATWPLGDGDTLITAIDKLDIVSITDSCGAGTFTYRVFVVNSVYTGYEVLAQSPPKTVTVAAPVPTPVPTPKPTAKSEPHPTAPPVQTLTLGGTGTDNGDNTYTVHLTWSKYTGPFFNYYGIVKSGPKSVMPADPTLSVGQTPNDGYYISDVNATSKDYKFQMQSVVTYVKFAVWAYSDASYAYVPGGPMPACTVETILGVSNIVTFTIPAKPASPTPTPTPTPVPPEPTPTPTPAV